METCKLALTAGEAQIFEALEEQVSRACLQVRSCTKAVTRVLNSVIPVSG